MSKSAHDVLAFEKPMIMGILNATPDSFSDGGKYMNIDRALDKIYIMLKNGADIIDIGGESTRPGAKPVSLEDELERVIPILKKAYTTFPNTTFSIDTTKYEVAKKAADHGATIINDVSGLQKDVRLANVAAEYGCSYVLMHSKGNPDMMQKNPRYEDVVEEVSDFFKSKIAVLNKRGVHKVILDPGIGFGKKLNHNLKLIAQLDSFTKFGLPILVGASRKSMIGQILDKKSAAERIIGTVSVHYHSLINGARILRVHDVKEAYESIRIFNAIQSQL